MKVSDKVKILRSPYEAPELGAGKTGTVHAFENGLVYVVMDIDFADPIGDLDWAFYPENLEIVE